MTFVDDDDEVFAGTHPGRVPTHLPVAPTRTDQPNTLRRPLVPIACFRLKEALFEFDSSFVLPAVATDLVRLRGLTAARPAAPLAVFGHTDPVGDDAYNKALSGRRAKAVFALLTRDADAWEALYGAPMAGDTWGLRVIERALATVRAPNTGVPYYTGPISDYPSLTLTSSVRAFQVDNGLAADGIAGPKTRKVLFLAYMDAVCINPSDPLVFPKEAFLGKGQTENGKVSYQGCGEHNPILLFSKADESRYASSPNKTERNARNRCNRRVLIYQFAEGTEVAEADWPCPAWDDGPGGCHGQFWPDGDARRTAGDAERRYRTDGRTMACRFYDRFAHRSPCEGVAQPLLVSVDVGRADREPDGELLVRAKDGVVWLRAAMSAAAREGTLCTFELDPARLPDPVAVVWDRGDHEEPVFALCSLSSLRDDLRADALRDASSEAYGAPDGS